ncbi:MAG: HAD-IIIA family hydrolase, partial [Thiohalocapsa sp.]
MKVVILDRDGVVNEDSPDYIRSPEAIRPIPGSLEAIARFTQAGVQVAIATNQSGLARGLFDIDALNRMHSLLCTRAA